MQLSSQRWLRVVFWATALVFLGVAVYVYALRFSAWIDSDAAVPVLLADKVLHARSPVVGDWYYANGDVWALGPQLLAALPVAILGLGPASLLATLVGGFVLEIVVLGRLYLQLAGERWVALLATMATLMAWSNAHVAYAYLQLAYGFLTCLYLLAFHGFARLAAPAPVRPGRLVAAGLLVAVISVQNPTRGLVYLVAPVVAGCLWPWRGLAVRRRLVLAAAAIAGWGLAFAVYTGPIGRAVAFSVPRGHLAFVVGGATRMGANLAMLGRGLALLCGGGSEAASVRLLPGALLVVGAVALVGREALAARAVTALRFLCVVVLAQLGAVLVPLVVGNLLDGTVAVRYVMPSLIATIGLAVVIAVQAVAEAGRGWGRRLAIGWLVALPVAAAVAAPGARPPAPERDVWPHAAELATVADELVRRGLTHGFGLNLTANLVTLDSGGAALTCPIYFRDIIMPLRWLAGTSCYAAAGLPDRFYIIAYQAEHDRAAIRATLPPEAERFTVGPTYEIYVYRTADTPLSWLELPLPDGERATFPMRIPATNLQLVRGKAVATAGELVATGEPGMVLHGPYLELPKGDYEVRWIGHGLDVAGQLAFRVTLSTGHKVLAQGVLETRQVPRGEAELIRLAFHLDRARAGLEFPIESTGGGQVALHELVIEKRR